MFKTFPIVLDVTKHQLNDMFQVNSNDLNTVRLNLSIKSGLDIFDLTGKIVRIAIKKPDGFIAFQTGGVTDPSNGLCEFILDRQAYLVEGKHEAEVMIYQDDSTVIVTERFYYKVNRAIANDKTLISTNHLPAINQAIIAGEQLKDIDIPEFVEAANSAYETIEEAETQGNYAKGQGDYAKQKADEAATRITQLNGVDAVQFKDRQDGFDSKLGVITELGPDYRTIVKSLSDYGISVKDFGAIGDGLSHPLSERFPTLALAQMRYPFVTNLTDQIDWAACQSAMDYAKTKHKTSNFGNSSSVSVGLKVLFPLGSYVLNRSIVINTASHVLIEGESAVFSSTSTGITSFDITAHWCSIKGIKTVNMDIGIKYKNANIDGGFLRLDECEFKESYSQAITFDAMSSDLTLDKCKLIAFSRPTSNMIKVITGTTISLNDTWIEGNCAYMFDIDSERFSLNDCSGVPTGDSTWLVLRKGNFFANNTRFGGEGNACIVENRTNYLSGNMCRISLDECLIACGDGKVSPAITKPIFKLYDIPQGISVKRSTTTGTSTMYGAWVDPALGAEPINRLRNMTIDTDLPFMITGNPEARKVVFPPDYLATMGTSHIKTSDLITNQMITATDYSMVEAFNGCAVDKTAVDDYGNPMIKVTSLADGATLEKYYNDVDPGTNTNNPNYYYERRFDGALSFENVSGVHTAVFVIEILTGGLHNVKFYAGNSEKVYKLNQGLHVIAFPFYLDTVNDARKRMGVRVSNLFPGSSFQIGKFRAFRGYANVRGINTIVYGSAKPSTALKACGVWSKGDEVKNTNVSNGQPNGWACVTTGTIGTWEPIGNIGGTMVSLDGSVFKLTIGNDGAITTTKL